MNFYTKIQKFIASLLIFSTFFSFTFNITLEWLIQTIFAWDNTIYNIVSIVVQEEIYDTSVFSSSIKSKIEDYAKNIQKTLPNTKVLIFPMPKTTSPFSIASLNEKLYNQWYKWLDGLSWESKLIWTVLVWDLPIPVVKKDSEYSKTVLPYVDFTDKMYTYNHQTNLYEYSLTPGNTDVEIWHGFISPNTWNSNEDIKLINNYFEKNNDYYNKKNQFKSINTDKPYVFYYDQIRENQYITDVWYEWYQAYIANLEDLTYDRYTKDLLNRLKSHLDKEQSDQISDLKEIPGLESVVSSLWNSDDIYTDLPDIQIETLASQFAKKYLEAFNKAWLWEFKDNIFWAWRYNSTDDKVNYDSMPYLLSALDEVFSIIIKWVNVDIEWQIDDLVKNKWLSRKIPVLTNATKASSTKYKSIQYKNYYSWTSWSSIVNAQQCTVFRWSLNDWTNNSQMVQSVKTFDLSNKDRIETDTKELTKYISLKREWAWYSFPQPIVPITTDSKLDGSYLYWNHTVLNLDNWTTKLSDEITQAQKDYEANKLNYNQVKALLETWLADAKQELSQKQNLLSALKSKQTQIDAVQSEITFLSWKTCYKTKNWGICSSWNLKNCSYSTCDSDSSSSSNCCSITVSERLNWTWKNQWSSNYDEWLINKLARLKDEKTKIWTICSIWEDDETMLLNQYSWSTCEEFLWRKEEDSTFLKYTETNVWEMITDLEEEISSINEDLANLKEQIETLTYEWDDWSKSLYKPYYTLQYSNFVKPVYSITWSKALGYSNWKQVLPVWTSFSNWIYPSTQDCSKNNIMLESYYYDKKTSRVKNKSESAASVEAFNNYVRCDNPLYEKVTNVVKHVKKRWHKKWKRYYVSYTFRCEFIPDSPLVWDPILPSGLKFNSTWDFNTVYSSWSYWITLNWTKLKTWSSGNLTYKSILWVVEHKSPTDAELKAQKESKVTPNLPVDEVRYVDFISATWNYEKIIYPQLFSLLSAIKSTDTIEQIKAKIKESLDKKSSEINAVLTKTDVSKLSTKEKEIYNLFKVADLNIKSINLYDFIKNHKTIEFDWKNVEYADMIAMALYWNSLTTVSGKYRFIIKNYLSSFKDSDKTYLLPANKSTYEIGYMTALWDAQNMHIKVDPTDKWENPFADLESQKANLDGVSTASSTTTSSSTETSTEKCFPPEWVELSKWWPAVQCRWKDTLDTYKNIKLKNMLSKSPCSTYTLWEATSCMSKTSTLSWFINKWVLSLSSTTKQLYYNSTAYLEARFYSWEDEKAIISIDVWWENKINFSLPEWVTLKDLNNLWVDFFLKKLEVPKDTSKDFSDTNKVLIYDKNNDSYNKVTDFEKALTYIDFTNWKSNFKSWIAKYIVKSKMTDVNLVFWTTFTYWDITKTSNDFEMQVRWDMFFSSNYKLSNYNNKLTLSNWVNSATASDNYNVLLVDLDKFNTDKTDLSKLKTQTQVWKDAVYINLASKSKSWEKLSLEFPLKYEITQPDAKILSWSINSLNDFYKWFKFSKAWTYKFILQDNLWRQTSTNIEILPEKLAKIEAKLSNNLSEKDWTYIYWSLALYDKYDNFTKWDVYDVKWSISNKWFNILSSSDLLFDNGLTDANYRVLEWVYNFRLKTKDSTWDNTLKFEVNWLSTTQNIKVVDEIQAIFSLDNALQVWDKNYNYKLNIKNIDNFNWKAYLSYDDAYLSSNTWWIQFVNSQASGTLKTTKKATEKTTIKVYVDGKKSPILVTPQILPDKPMKIQITQNVNTIEASTSSKVSLIAALQDIYWNTVFTDNDTVFTLDIPEKYSEIISVNSKTRRLNKWVIDFELTATDIPGRAYYTITSNTSLSDNKVVFTDSTWKKTQYEWVDKSVWTLETFYFWNKKEITWNNYNTLYTTLLWGPYWDLTQKDNLANSLLFDKDNKALAVTTFLSTPFKKQNVLNILGGWAVNIINSTDLSIDVKTDISFWSKWLNISLSNSRLTDKIGDIYINPQDNTISKCSKDLITDCLWENWYVLKILDSNYVLTDDWVFRNNYSNVALFSNKSNMSSALSFKLNSNYTSNLVLNVYDWEDLVAMLGLWKLNSAIKQLKSINDFSIDDEYSVLISWINYSSLWEYIWNSTWDTAWITVIYNDPLSASSKKEVDTFASDFSYWYENFVNTQGIWWTWENKTLLYFSAWNSVWESTKQFQSFHAINLWDPVLSLDTIKQDLPWTTQKRAYDSTIWTLLSDDKNNVNYTVFDYNNDNILDIAVLKKDWFIELFEWTGDVKNFISRWNLAYFVDIWDSDTIVSGDFTWDWYDDIALLDKNKKIILLNNTQKKFERINLDLTQWLAISQLLAKDMDIDWKTDLVTMDEKWDIINHYWTSTKAKFESKLIWNNWWVRLNSASRKDGWAVYFDGVPQVWLNKTTQEQQSDKDIAKSYLDKINAQIASDKAVKEVENTTFKNTWEIWTQSTSNLNYSASDSVDFESVFNSKMFSVINYSKKLEDWTSTWKTYTFIKSDYSHHKWLDVSKTYKNITTNSDLIKSWNLVQLDINLKNTTSSTLKDLIYVEDLPEFLVPANEPKYSLVYNWQTYIDKNVALKWSNWDYDFLLDWYIDADLKEQKLNLLPNQEIKLSMVLQVVPFSYWHIDVWNYDTTQKDLDIIFKPKDENCWLSQKMYKSTAPRNYTETTTIPETQNSSLENDSVTQVQDFINNLDTTKPEETLAALEELQKQLDDSATDTSNTGNYLDYINQSVDDAVAWIDKLAETFNCWNGSAGCLSVPFNRAPLAPWNDPVLYWYPIWDWFHVNEWLPIFSAMTTALPTPVWPIPFVWPPIAGWAWGRLWASAPYNFLRIFVTPTVTWSMWTAICFGQNRAAGYIPPPWLSPFVPAWNCIVTTTKSKACKDDWSSWDVWSTVVLPKSWDYPLLLVGNCTANNSTQLYIPDDLAWDYLAYLNWDLSKKTSVYKYFAETRLELDSYLKSKWFDPNTIDAADYELPEKSLISVADSNWYSWDFDLSIDVWNIDLSQIGQGWFKDVVQLNLKKIPSFPWVIMSWVEAQITEIITKLTSFPSLYITLPDWNKVLWINSWNEKQEEKTETSWISQVYEFLSELPVLDIKEEKISINVPWIDQEVADNTVYKRKQTITQRQTEIDKYKTWLSECKWETQVSGDINGWSVSSWWKNCNVSASFTQDLSKFITKLETNISILNKNIEIIESYKKIPEQLHSLINVKEKLLEQILCNIEQLSEMTSGWITTNWKIFKSWVDLYILAKAILKSYQLLLDVFFDFSSSCKECKNERGDSQQFIWSLISSVLPTMPIIKFPKWPDIFIDLSKFKTWIEVSLPNFDINPTPIIFPDLPSLKLPDLGTISASTSWNITFDYDFKDIPLLQEVNLDDILVQLEMPSLPVIELPSLPPAPKLPKIPTQITQTLNILKLVTKAMCLLKMLPFVPEWRAWDQIAFLTQSSWLRSFDFKTFNLPQFEYSYIDALKVDTYVNLNFDSDFIIEMSKALAKPFNEMVTDYAGLFDISLWSIDLSSLDSKLIKLDANYTLDIWWKETNFASKYNLTLDGDTYELNDENIKKIKEYYSNVIKNVEFWDFVKLWTDSDEFKSNLEKLQESIDDFNNTYTSDNIKSLSKSTWKDEKELIESLKEVKIEFETFQTNFKTKYKDLETSINSLKSEWTAQDVLKNNEELLKYFEEKINLFNEKITKIDNVLSYNPTKTDIVKNNLFLALWISKWIQEIHKNIEQNSKVEYTTEEFKAEIAKELKNKELYSNPTTSKIAWIWDETLKYSFETEDNKIKELDNKNKSKFDTYSNIVKQELENITLEKQKVDNLFKVKPNNSLLVAEKTNKIDYSKQQKYKDELLLSYNKLTQENTLNNSLKTDWQALIKTVSTWVKNYSNEVKLASTTSSSTDANATAKNILNNSQVSYTYKWVYVLEKYNWKNISYRLYDYLWDFLWDEIIKYDDLDNDWDKDALFMSKTQIYIKQNLNKNPETKHYTGSPIVITSSNNPFLNYMTKFIEWVNKFKSWVSENGYINVVFNSSTDKNINSYKLEFYDIVDKFGDVFSWLNNDYVPRNTLAYLIDAFSNISEINVLDRYPWMHIKNNIAHFSWNNLSWVKVTTLDLINLKEGNNWYINVWIKPWIKIYSWNSNVKLEYLEWTTKKEFILSKYQNISFDNDVTLTYINNPLYVKWTQNVVLTTIEELKTYMDKPLFEWTVIEKNGDTDAKINIEYHNWNESLLDFSKIKYYEIVDLWEKAQTHLIRTSIKNDFYYARMQAFNKNVFSTYTSQELIAPQKESDTEAPEIGVFGWFKTPVYQTKTYDMTDFVFENAWIKSIDDIFVDFDLDKDTSGDWDTTNDRDYYLWNKDTKFNILVTKSQKILFEIGSFDKLINKKVRIYVMDNNQNKWYRDVLFQIYSPSLEISNIENNSIVWTLWEELKDEPVSFYRVRGWGLYRLKDTKNNTTSSTFANWWFKFESSKTSSWLTLKVDWKDVAVVSEFWKIDLVKDFYPPNLREIDVYTSNDTTHNYKAYPKIVLKNISGEEIYYHYIVTPNVWKVNVVNSFDWINTSWIYYKQVNKDYSYSELPLNISYNPGDLVITYWDSIIWNIFKDWKINLDPGYILKYWYYSKYVVFDITKDNVVIWQIMLIPEENYIME